MNRVLILVLFFSITIGESYAQQRGSRWSIAVGGQVSHALAVEPERREDPSTSFQSGYSPAYGLGGLTAVQYNLTPRVALTATLGADAQHFSYALLGPPTFGETGGRSVPGRYLTEFEGVGVTGFLEMGTEVKIGSADWAPALLLEIGSRYWIMEHSNADAAYAAGYQTLAGRYQAHVGAGFGVSPFASTHQLSLLFQRTLAPDEPLFQTLILRQTFSIKTGGRSIACPTF